MACVAFQITQMGKHRDGSAPTIGANRISDSFFRQMSTEVSCIVEFYLEARLSHHIHAHAYI